MGTHLKTMEHHLPYGITHQLQIITYYFLLQSICPLLFTSKLYDANAANAQFSIKTCPTGIGIQSDS